ncbi:MAG TPA: amidohydrolase family protein [Planctomycetota bacterium]
MIPILALMLPMLFQGPAGEDVYALKAAKVFTAGDAGVLNNAIVLVRGKRIAAVGRADQIDLPPGTPVIDLGEQWLAPGLHEPHNHAADSGNDINDMVHPTNPDLRVAIGVDPDNPANKDALAGGVTTALFIPGSGTNIGGFGALIKMAGHDMDDMLVMNPGSLKVAQSGNPERWYPFVGRSLMNWNTRDTLQRGLGWAEGYAAGEIGWSDFWRDFEPLLAKDIPVSVHTQIYQVVLMTLTMQKQELGLDPFIDHGTFDGYKLAKLAAELKVPVMNGPRQFFFDRTNSRIQGCGAGWAEAVPDGLVLGYNTDSGGVPQEELSYQAAMGVRLGHDDPEGALKGITSYAAFALKCDDVSGRLEPGLEADMVAWTGFPLDPRSFVTRTWIRGELVYDAERDGRRF